MNANKLLSDRQKLILDFIKDKIKINGYPPSVREIAQAVGLKSSSTVHNHLVQMEQKGYIKRDPAKPRAIIPIPQEDEIVENKLSFQALPLLGKVAAGQPILAVENIDGYLPLPPEFVGRGTHFVLRVQGESMIEDGILDGDYIIIRQQADASNGEIVVALVENEATVKRYFKRDRQVELRPANSTMQSIFSREVTIVGKVTGLLRRI